MAAELMSHSPGFPEMLLPGSGMDWCEQNYRYSYIFAEFFNTISNLPLIVLPLLGLKLSDRYINQVNPAVRWVYILMIGVGITSTYYHATLSLFGQLLDELCLLWVSAAAFIVWLPFMSKTPKWMKARVTPIRWLCGIATILVSLLGFWQPHINAYVLMTFCIPAVVVLVRESRTMKCEDGIGLANAILFTWVVALSVWISDRMMCNFWRHIGFPYLHAIWHVCSAIASYMAIVAFSYFDASTRVPHLHPRIMQSPSYSIVKLPYIAFSG